MFEVGREAVYIFIMHLPRKVDLNMNLLISYSYTVNAMFKFVSSL